MEVTQKEERAPQKIRVLNYMKEHGSITHKDAERDLGCARLAARIRDLVKDGYKISSTMEKGMNRLGETERHARYRLVS